jgi:hypothetical protein
VQRVLVFIYVKICSLLARRRSSQPVQRVYWPENVIDWLGEWQPTCVMRHARGQKLQSFRRKWPFCMDLYSVLREGGKSLILHVSTSALHTSIARSDRSVQASLRIMYTSKYLLSFCLLLNYINMLNCGFLWQQTSQEIKQRDRMF